jgi:hypothetical protein
VLIVAGLQVPIMPLAEMVGKTGAVEFWHKGPIAINWGSVGAIISMPSGTEVAHCPSVGVNVYVVVPAVNVLIVTGVQVPVMPLAEMVGKTGAVEFWHKGPIAINWGSVGAIISMSSGTEVAHCPSVGVNVYVAVPAVNVLIVTGVQVPVMPLAEMVGKTGATEFWHNGPIAINWGSVGAIISMSSGTGVAHCPSVGVNVYVAVPAVNVLIVAGVQVPVMPLIEVAGKTGTALFWHKGPIALNSGSVGAVISMSSGTEVAHCPSVGVNVYIAVPVVNVLIVAGLQVPEIPLIEVVGNNGAALFRHDGPIAEKTGAVEGKISMSRVAEVAHCPGSGVKV